MRSVPVMVAAGVALGIVVNPPVAQAGYEVARLAYDTVVGRDVWYSAWDYVRLTWGVLPLHREALPDRFADGALAWIGGLAAVAATALAGVGLAAAVIRRERPALLLLAFGAPFVVLLIYVAVVPDNPFVEGDQRGQPWSFYKGVQYGFFAFAAAVGLAVEWGWRHRRPVGKALVLSTGVLLLPATAYATVYQLHHTADEMEASTLTTEDSLAAYFDLREAVLARGGGAGYFLLFAEDARAHRRMVAYMLQETPVVADWRRDPLMSARVPPERAFPGYDESLPVLYYDPAHSPGHGAEPLPAGVHLVHPGRLRLSSTIQATGPPRILQFGPPGTRAGVPFLVQPNGDSALWIACENATIETVLYFDGVPLHTSFGSDRGVSGTVPPELFARPGAYDIYLVDGDQRSNTVTFVVEP
jgi:hypothetical protein